MDTVHAPDCATSWASLDRNSILAILACLDCHVSLCTASRVCRELHELGTSNALWLPLLASRFGLKLQVRAQALLLPTLLSALSSGS